MSASLALLFLFCACADDPASRPALQERDAAEPSSPSERADGGNRDAGERAPDAARLEQADAAAPVGKAGDKFDPSEVYLVGTVTPGLCRGDVVVPLETPSAASIGFDCGVSFALSQIRPTDGRLLYERFGGPDRGLYAFRCDACTAGALAMPFPENPGANDEQLATPGCSESEPFEGWFQVALHGDVYHQCGDRWFDQSGTLRSAETWILSFGANNTALTQDGILSLPGDRLTAFAGLPVDEIVATRARDDGYWLAIQGGDRTKVPAELWHVTLAGKSTRVGTYPLAPPDQEVPLEGKLDGKGRLVQVARNKDAASDSTIVRRSIEGESVIVFDDDESQTVKLFAPRLVTGP